MLATKLQIMPPIWLVSKALTCLKFNKRGDQHNWRQDQAQDESACKRQNLVQATDTLLIARSIGHCVSKLLSDHADARARYQLPWSGHHECFEWQRCLQPRKGALA